MIARRYLIITWAFCAVSADATQNGAGNVSNAQNATKNDTLVVNWSKLPPTCSSLTRTACSVITAQNLTFFVRNRLLQADTSAERAALLDEITDPASNFGTFPSDFAAEVYNFEDVCVANAREPSLVGQPLSRALAARGVLADGAKIGKEFQAAAMAGGAWVSHLDRGGRWDRTFILGFASGAVFPTLTPGNFSSLQSMSKTQLFYLGVSYMDEVDATTECDADGGPAGKFKSCQPEAAFNLVMHVQASLNAARSDPDPVVFTLAVEQLNTKFSSFGKNFYVSMHSISTSVCVTSGHRTSSIGKELRTTIDDGGNQPAAKELHEKFKEAAATKRGRWVWHMWPSDSVPPLDYGGSRAADAFVDRFSFVVAVEGRRGSVYEDRYYLFSGFSDVENSGLGAPFLNGIFCKANARTGCSVMTAQNLLFDAEAALDASANPVDVFDKINTASVFPKNVGKVYAWQGFLQQPIGFYVFAVNASNGYLLSYGANPTMIAPKKDLYELTECLGLVTTPFLPRLFFGYASWVCGGWIPFYWTDNNKEAGMLPRRRAYVLPWQRGLGGGVPEAYIGVGYDDMHPNDVGLPISATDFVLGSEDYSVNLVQAMVADLAQVVSGGAVLIDGKRYTTMQEIFDLVTFSPHYKLAKIPQDPGYYAFIYFYNGTCISHGGASANVGKVLQQILAARNLLGEI